METEQQPKKDFWDNVENNAINPDYLMAKILAERGLGVSVSDEERNSFSGENMPSYVAVYAPEDVRKIMDRISSTQGMKTLFNCFESASILNLDSCDWD